MQDVFPFGFPWPTAFYLTWYLLTLVIHVIFMNYVLAGSAYLAVVAVLAGQSNLKNPIALILRDWMPFILSAAITAGVAPLLFVQILYQSEFYSANLLLFHRWMAILPALIVGFYLLYLLKGKLVGQWPLWGRALVGCGAFACFAFTGWSWTENHLLSLSRDVWADQYVSERLMFHSRQLLPRLVLWFTGAFPTLAMMVAWQLWYPHRNETSLEASPGTRRTAALALCGLAVSTLAALVYGFTLSDAQASAILSRFGFPYLCMAAVGIGLQAWFWRHQYRASRFEFRPLVLVSVGVGLAVVGTSVLRECVRIASIDMERLYDRHRDAAEVGGLFAFVFFFLVNVGLIAFCMMIVKRNLLPSSDKVGQK